MTFPVGAKKRTVARSMGSAKARIRLHLWRRWALVVLIAAVGSWRAAGQCVEEQKLTGSDVAADDGYGVSVSLREDVAVVGAWRDDCQAGADCGSAYVYRFDGSTWVEEQKLTAFDAAAGDEFGFRVSASHDRVAVGARLDDCRFGAWCGAVYVYRWDGSIWDLEQKLTSPNPGVHRFFGTSVSLNGDRMLVGSPRDDCAAGADCGAAYVYRFNGVTWVLEQKLTAPDAGPGDDFGFAVSLSDGVALVGARLDASAYVFRFDGATWTHEQTLVPPAAKRGGLFGSAVSVDGNVAVVGASRDGCDAGPNCGSAYVFRFNGSSWDEERRLTAFEAAANDFFGDSVSVDDNVAVVGVMGADCPAGFTCGATYVYRFNGFAWVLDQKLTLPEAADGDFFGRSVTVDRELVLVCAHEDNCSGDADCGVAYVFSCLFEPTLAGLEIKPGGCRDPVNPKSRGVVPVALVGDVDFDVATVVPESLMLGRADGIGESVAPRLGRPGPGIRIVDLATVHSGEPCECHEAGGDGIDDLSLKFSTAEMNRAFDLESFLPGATVELVLRGSLDDGTRFEAVDCITMPGVARPAAEPKRERR